jgi:hypothetical protein
MDRVTYDDLLPRDRISRRASGSPPISARAGMAGRRTAAVRVHATFRVSCTRHAARVGPGSPTSRRVLETHLSEDAGELAAVRESFPEAVDYLDDLRPRRRPRPRTILAHAIHLSPREIDRLAETGTRVGTAPPRTCSWRAAYALARYQEADSHGSRIDFAVARMRRSSPPCASAPTRRCAPRRQRESRPVLDPSRGCVSRRSRGRAPQHRRRHGSLERQGGRPDRGRSRAHGTAAGRRGR